MKKLVSLFLLIVVLLLSFTTLVACGDNNSTSTQQNCNHAYSKINSEASCYIGGDATYKCSLCEDTYTKYESALGHDYVEATCTQVKHCSRCSYTLGSALGHTTENGTCSRCYTYIGKKWTKTEIQNTIKVYDVWIDEINSVGGVSMKIGWENTSSKTIKYIHFYVQPYNAVGDIVYCEIRDTAKFRAWSTGPYEPGYKIYKDYGYGIISGMYWENCWYNNTVSYIELYQIRIEYMDGSEITIGENFIDYVFVS